MYFLALSLSWWKITRPSKRNLIYPGALLSGQTVMNVFVSEIPVTSWLLLYSMRSGRFFASLGFFLLGCLFVVLLEVDFGLVFGLFFSFLAFCVFWDDLRPLHHHIPTQKRAMPYLWLQDMEISVQTLLNMRIQHPHKQQLKTTHFKR